MKILLAEDDKVSGRMLELLLKSWGHEVVIAEDGEEAWNRLQEEHYPIVISDWMMPKIDGIELVRLIRDKLTGGYTYTVLLTAKSRKDDIVQGMEAGADDFIIKPFNVSELQTRLRAGERIINLEQNLARHNEKLEKLNLEIAETNRRMKRDLEAAARIQHSLLPQSFPKDASVNFAWRYIPCDELAGDTLNVIRLDNRNVGLYVLDVSGHGVPSSLLSVALNHLLSPSPERSNLLKRITSREPGYVLTTPDEVARHLNRQYPLQDDFGLYFTLLYGILNLDDHTYRYSQAGHPSPVVIPREGPARFPEGSGLPIGFFEEAEYDEYTLQLNPGDRMVLYSDGVYECMNPTDEQFGKERFCQALENNRHLPLREMLDAVVRNVQDWSGTTSLDDDLSLLSVEIVGD